MPAVRRVDRLGVSVILQQAGPDRTNFEWLHLALRADEIRVVQGQCGEV